MTFLLVFLLWLVRIRTIITSIELDTQFASNGGRALVSSEAKREFLELMKAKLRRKRGEAIEQWLRKKKVPKIPRTVDAKVNRTWVLETEHKWALEPSISSSYTFQEWRLVNRSVLQEDRLYGNRTALYERHYNGSAGSLPNRKRVEGIRQCRTGFVRQGYWSSFVGKKVSQCEVRGAADRPGLFSRWIGEDYRVCGDADRHALMWVGSMSHGFSA